MTGTNATLTQLLAKTNFEAVHTYSLWVFIAHYDKDGNVTRDPPSVVRTEIETHEQDTSTLPTGGSSDTFFPEQDLKEPFNNIKPIKIPFETRMDGALVAYFKSFFSMPCKEPKHISFKITDAIHYKKYKIRPFLLNTLLKSYYTSFVFDLYDREVVLDPKLNCDIVNFKMSNARLIVTDQPIFSCDRFELNKIRMVGITSKDNFDVKPVLTINAKTSVKIIDIVQTDTIVDFSISTKNTDMVKWMNTTVNISNVYLYYRTQKLTSKLYPFINVYGCRNVKINNVMVGLKETDMNLMKFEDCLAVELLMINVDCTERFLKHQIIVKKCEDFKLVSSTFNQASWENRTKSTGIIPKILHFTNNGEITKTQIVLVKCINIGLANLVSDHTDKFIILNTIVEKCYEPILMKQSLLNNFQILESVFSDISRMEIFANNVNVTNTELPLKELTLHIYKSCILNKPVIECEDFLKMIEYSEDSKITFNGGLIKAKNIDIGGTNANGVLQCTATRIIGEIINFIGLSKIALPEGYIEGTEVTFNALIISDVTSQICLNTLNNLNLIGRILTTDFNFVSQNNKRNVFNFKTVDGKYKMQFDKTRTIDLNLTDCQSKIHIINTDTSDKLKVNLKTISNNIGSTVFHKDYVPVTIIPVAEGNFGDLQAITLKEDLTTSKYVRSKILYGTAPGIE